MKVEWVAWSLIAALPGLYWVSKGLFLRWVEWRIWRRFSELGPLKRLSFKDQGMGLSREMDGIWVWEIPSVAGYWVPQISKGRAHSGRNRIEAVVTSSYLRLHGWPQVVPRALSHGTRQQLAQILKWEWNHRSQEPSRPLRSVLFSIQDDSRV